MSVDFTELRGSIGNGDVLLPGQEGYDESLHRWSATSVKPAVAVIRPTTATEASAALRFLTSHSIKFVVRGGGHNPSGESAAPSPEDAVIDLSLMRSVSVNPEAQLVTYGGGCTWADVDNALWEHGLATVGGTVSHTGVGGLVLGGGYGMLTGRYGMSVDILVSCEVVLANGDVVTASETENEDLFWALRGAGPSFGIVTAFTSRAFPQGKVWGGLMIWPTHDVLDQLVSFINEFHEKTDGNQWFMPLILADPASGARMLGATLFYNGAAKDAEQFYAPLLAMQPVAMNTTGEIPYPVSNTLQDPMAKPMRRYMFGGANFVCPLDAQLLRDVADEFYAGLNKPGNEDIRTSAVGLELIPQKKILEYGKLNKTSFNGRDGKYNVVLLMSWDKPETDGAVKEIVTKTTAVFKAKNTDDQSPGTYLNYLNPDVPADRAMMRSGRLFGDKLPRLQDVKAKYDPKNIFQKKINLQKI